jgi:hypothetical protein
MSLLPTICICLEGYTTDSFSDMKEFGTLFNLEKYPDIHLGQDRIVTDCLAITLKLSAFRI